MFEDLKESLGLSTSPEGGVFNFEHGPVAEHINSVYGAVLDLREMSKGYELNSIVRESVGAGWATRANVVAEVTGVEIADGVGEELIDMTYGDQLGGLRAPVDASAIMARVEELRKDSAHEIVAEEVISEIETPQVETVEGAEVIDFTEAQRQKALLIEAQESIVKAYRDHQIAA